MKAELAPWALLCGLTALVPVPFVDAWLERRFTAAMFRRVAETHGQPLPDDAARVLTEDRSSVALGCLYVVVVWPLKKLFRTVFYFLTVKDVLDGITRAAHRATFVDVAYAEGLLPGHASDVRGVMDGLLDKVRHSPVTRPLYRQERPALPFPPAPGFAARVVHALQRQGGGGLLLAQFHERLAALRSGA